MSQDVVLIAGTIFEHQLPDGSWKRVPKVTVKGATGEQSEAKEKTVIEDTIRKYGSGLRDAPDKNLSGYYIPPQKEGDAHELDRELQQIFIARCRAEEEFPMRITFPDLERCNITFKALGYQIDDATQEDWKVFTVNGKQNSRPEWSEAEALTGITLVGNTTMTVGQPEDLEVVMLPANAYYTPDLRFETSDHSIATVTPSGHVKPIKAGTVVISAWLGGVEGTLEITVA